MIDFIARYFSSFWELITAPFRVLWRIIERLFPARECTVMDTVTGNVHNYNQNSFWRFTKFCATTTMCIWATWSTYVYVYHRPLLQKRTQQLEQIRNKHERQMTDLKTYLKKYNDLARNLNITDDKILKSDKEKISDNERENLINTRSKTIGELDFLHVQISEMMENDEYTPEFDKLSEISMEFELLKNENNTLKERYSNIATESREIADADQQIVDIVSKITSEGITELRNQIKRINASIIKLGHKDMLVFEPWPTFDESKLVESDMTIVVSVNGKRVNDFVVPVDIAEPDLIEAAKNAASRQLAGATIIKTIVVPKKLVNFVVKK